MSTLALEIHDAGVLAIGETRPREETPPASPGVALADGDALVTGEAAVRRARLLPRHVDHRFWQRLDHEPLARPFRRGLCAADLAHAHLADVWRQVGRGVQRTLLVVPGCYSEAQLGLLLGIARACEIPVTGLVDAAVAAARGAPGQRLLHLDIHLHRTLATEVLCRGELVRGHLEASDELGLVALRDAWARRISELCVRATRFDPLHSAASEQALYDRLPGWLEQLRDADRCEIAVAAGGEEIPLELERAQLVDAVEAPYARLLEGVRALRRAGEPLTVLLAHRLAELPGLAEQLAELRDTRVLPLAAGAAAAGALAARTAIEGPLEDGAVPFVTHLPTSGAAAPPAAPPRLPDVAPLPSPGPRPTHVLHGSRAWPITAAPFLLGVAAPEGRGLRLAGATDGISRRHCRLLLEGERALVEDLSTWGTFLNGERVAGRAALAAGDRLRLGSPGVELRLIRVEE